MNVSQNQSKQISVTKKTQNQKTQIPKQQQQQKRQIPLYCCNYNLRFLNGIWLKNE